MRQNGVSQNSSSRWHTKITAEGLTVHHVMRVSQLSTERVRVGVSIFIFSSKTYLRF